MNGYGVTVCLRGGDVMASGAPERVDSAEVQALLRSLKQAVDRYPLAARTLLGT